MKVANFDQESTDPTNGALERARELIRIGVPLFVAKPALKLGRWDPDGGTGNSGYWLPKNWEKTRPDLAVLESWKPGYGLAAVMGLSLDVIDIDPRNGGEATAELWRDAALFPEVYALAATPSGGTHSFIAPLGIGKTNESGVDLQGGRLDGSSRGFVWIAPTTKRSKVDQELRAYEWLVPPTADDIRVRSRNDQSGRALAERLSGPKRVRKSGTTTPRRNPKRGLAELEAAPAVEGGRHTWLTRIAGHDALLFRHSKSAYEIAVKNHNQLMAVPLNGLELQQIIEDIWNDDVQSRGRETPLEDSPLTEVIAERLQSTHRWASGLGWVRYDGKRWRECTEAAVVEITRKTFKTMFKEELDNDASPDRAKRLTTLLTNGKIRAVVSLLRGILEVDANEFDRHPDLLNCANGVIDLVTGELRPHDPNLLLTKITPVRFEPGAESVDWLLALEALPSAVADWFQVRVGQAATGYMTSDDLLPILQGGGSNGKSTIVDSIFAALSEHALIVPEKVLTASAHDHPTEMTTLMGARVAVIEELPEGARFSVKRLKDTLGTAKITARKIQKDNITWDATHSLFVTTNYRPRVNETDHGTWRRLALVRFPFTFKPGAEPSGFVKAGDRRLRERLRSGQQGQHEAVLAWIVAGALRWYKAGKTFPPIPAEVEQDTNDWRSSTDLILSYVTENLQFAPGSKVLTSDLYEHFSGWLEMRGQAGWGDQLFTERFEGHEWATAHGVYKVRTTALSALSRPLVSLRPTGAKQRVWVGIAFQEAVREADEGQPEGGLW